jgi:catechol 2,3-dioxygenase-like lactoylglutathione lyase family enzyme
MQPFDLAIPMLPSRSIPATVAFYHRLGFTGGAHEASGSYAILRRGTVELHFFTHHELVPTESAACCYVRVQDVDAMHRAFAAAGELPRHGIPRLEPPADRPWGLREFALVDADGNLLRIG